MEVGNGNKGELMWSSWSSGIRTLDREELIHLSMDVESIVRPVPVSCVTRRESL